MQNYRPVEDVRSQRTALESINSIQGEIMKAPVTTAQAMNHPDVVLTINTLGKMADELRAALQERDAEIAGWKADQKENLQIQVDQHQVVTAQRKVLEQALEVIKYIGYVPRADGSHPVEKAITAIQEQLNGQD